MREKNFPIEVNRKGGVEKIIVVCFSYFNLFSSYPLLKPTLLGCFLITVGIYTNI